MSCGWKRNKQTKITRKIKQRLNLVSRVNDACFQARSARIDALNNNVVAVFALGRRDG